MASYGIYPEKFGISSSLSPHSSVASALALSSVSTLFQPVDSFITFISLQSSYAWYLKLSQFETVFLSLLMLQICFFRYLEILPININNWFLGEPSGKKRRRRKRGLNFEDSSGKFDCDKDVLLKSLLKVLRKLDDGNCVSLTLCELESMSAPKQEFSNSTSTLSQSTRAILTVLKTSARYRLKAIGGYPVEVRDGDAAQLPFPYCPALDGLKPYEDAVVLGSASSHHHTNLHNSTICEQQYPSCPLTKQDVEHYIRILINANML